MNELILYVDGVKIKAIDVYDDLPRAVLISLFSWRRANSDDDLPNGKKMGWWGDTYSDGKIGSRLWLLTRAKLTTQTVLNAKDYAIESLQWLLDDGVASALDVQSERQEIDRLALSVKITRGDKTELNIRFTNVWDFINAI